MNSKTNRLRKNFVNIGIKGIHLFLLNTVIGMHMSLPFCKDLTVINLLIICFLFCVPVLASVSGQCCLIPTITIYFWEMQFLRPVVVVTPHMQRYNKGINRGRECWGKSPPPPQSHKLFIQGFFSQQKKDLFSPSLLLKHISI